MFNSRLRHRDDFSFPRNDRNACWKQTIVPKGKLIYYPVVIYCLTDSIECVVIIHSQSCATGFINNAYAQMRMKIAIFRMGYTSANRQTRKDCDSLENRGILAKRRILCCSIVSLLKSKRDFFCIILAYI